MIYRYFDFTFETNVPEFSMYLNNTDIPTDNFYEITFVTKPESYDGYNLISKKTIGENKIYYYSSTSAEFIIVHNMIGEYNINYANKKITIFPYNIEYVVPFFLNSVVASMYGYRGVLCLHGCSLLFENKNVILVVGDSGSGKSTFSQALLNESNTRLLSDDIVPLFFKNRELCTCFGTNVLKLRDYNGEGNVLPIRINDKHIVISKEIETNDYFKISDIIVLRKRVANSSFAYTLENIDNKLRQIFLHRFIKERYLVGISGEGIKKLILKINNTDVAMHSLQLKDDIDILKKMIMDITKHISRKDV